MRTLIRWIKWTFGTIFVAICALIIVISLSADLRYSIRNANCTPADPIRVVLNDVEYHLESLLEPHFFDGQVIRTRITFIEGRGIKQYCQSASVDATKVRGFWLDSVALSRVATTGSQFTRLSGIEQISLDTAQNYLTADTKLGNEVFTGNFLQREDNDGYHETISTAPLLFGKPMRVTCNPVGGSFEIINACTIYVQVSNIFMVRVRPLDTKHPPIEWRETFVQIEAFLASLARGVVSDK